MFFHRKSSGGAVTRPCSVTLPTRDKSAIKSKITSNQQLAKNYTGQVLETLKNEKYTHLLKTMFGVMI